MKVRFSFSYELSPEETAEKTKAIEKVALGAIELLTEIARHEYNESTERMRYANMEAERQNKRWDHFKGFGGLGGIGGFGKNTDSDEDPHDNGEPFEADGTRYGYCNPSDPDEQ
jgi:hypothetical protein